LRHVRAFLRLVMIEHSVFALPFAYLATVTAMRLHTQCGTVDAGWGDGGWFAYGPVKRQGSRPGA
jgi:hypothetical protein